jgi:ABC-type lipoprotein export system ATPase subunit
VVKNYGGLRPLRIASLEVRSGERVAVSGPDDAAAEVLVNLVTGATLPDEGTVRILGTSTAAIESGDEWLSSLDRFGIVSGRTVLLEASTLEQNLALPFTLQLEPLPQDVVAAVGSLASECGIDADSLSRPVAGLPPALRARVHLARAIALGPQLLILEHPTADIPEPERAAFGRAVASAAQARGLTTLAITADIEFAGVMAHRSLVLNAANGVLTDWKRKRRWF